LLYSWSLLLSFPFFIFLSHRSFHLILFTLLYFFFPVPLRFPFLFSPPFPRLLSHILMRSNKSERHNHGDHNTNSPQPKLKTLSVCHLKFEGMVLKYPITLSYCHWTQN
jgi:hypothetical protein